MAPTRVGIIGLSANPSGSGWAKTAHLPYLKANPNFEVIGVLNSSLASSQAAIDTFQLSAAKPFADVDSMASDPDIDLVVICVEVKMHYTIAKTILEHGKNLFCEWPLGQNSDDAIQLAKLAKQKGVQTFVDLESRLSPVSVKLRELIGSGQIGKVTSTDVIGTLGPPPKVWGERVAFYLDVKSGQSPLNTRFAHFIDAFCYSVGEFESFQSLLATHQKEVKLYNVPMSQLAEAAMDPRIPYKTVERTSPDEILLQGKLTNGALAAIHLRSGENDADGNLLRWIITGADGLIEVT
ncbi:NAD(P)-binding protein, partial [Lindgomyces ingoldianus]